MMKNAPLFLKTLIFKFFEKTEVNMPFSEVIRRYLYFLEYALSHANAKTWLQITFNEKLKSLKISHYLFKSFVSYLPCKIFVFKPKAHYKLLESSLSFENIANFTAEYLRNKKYLDCELFRMHFRHLKDHVTVTFPFTWLYL